MSDLSIPNSLGAFPVASDPIALNQTDLPTVDQIVNGIEAANTQPLLSVQEISAKVGILYDRTMWQLRRHAYRKGESISALNFSKSFEICTNNITKNLKSRKFNKVIEYFKEMIDSVNKLAIFEPETAEIVFPEGVEQVRTNLVLYASSIVALSQQEG